MAYTIEAAVCFTKMKPHPVEIKTGPGRSNKMPDSAQVKSVAKPLLTIAIPTYNRSSCLGELLSVLFDQLLDEPRVELLISDNASPDGTAALIGGFQSRGLSLRSIRNDTNIGPDANFLQCFEQAYGKYVWIFGDDDIIVPGGVAAVLSVLEEKDYELVFVDNYALHNPTKFSALSSLKTKSFDRVEDFIKCIHVNFTFISSNIVNKERVQDRGSFSALVGTNLVQLAWTYSALNHFEHGLYVYTKLVGARINNSWEYQLSDIFGSKLGRIGRTCLHSAHLQRLVLNGTIQRFWPGLLLNARKYRAFKAGFSPTSVLRAEFSDNPRYWFFVHPILVLPASLGAGWFFCTRVLNRIDKALGFVL